VPTLACPERLLWQTVEGLDANQGSARRLRPESEALRIGQPRSTEDLRKQVRQEGPTPFTSTL